MYPSAHPDCMMLIALLRCSGGHVSLTSTAPEAHSPPMPRPSSARQSINYGSNRVRFPAAVIVGARLRGRVRLQDAADMPSGGLRVTYETTVEIEGADRPACVAETMAVHYW